jgi:hypothetical protein
MKMVKRGLAIAIVCFALVFVLSTACSAADIDGFFNKNISNAFLLNTNPLSGEPPQASPLYSILVANLAIIIIDSIIFLSIYSFVSKFDTTSAKIFGLLVGYLLFVVPIFIFVPIAFILMTIFYMVGILIPALVKNKYIPVSQRISFGSGGFLNDEVKGFGSGIMNRDHNLYD